MSVEDFNAILKPLLAECDAASGKGPVAVKVATTLADAATLTMRLLGAPGDLLLVILSEPIAFAKGPRTGTEGVGLKLITKFRADLQAMGDSCTQQNLTQVNAPRGGIPHMSVVDINSRAQLSETFLLGAALLDFFAQPCPAYCNHMHTHLCTHWLQHL